MMPTWIDPTFLLSHLRWQDGVDITIITVVIYYLLVWTRNYRARNLLHGVFIILVLYFASDVLHLTTLSWLLQKIATVILLVFIIVFQPELRLLLEKLGQSTQLMRLLSRSKTMDEFFSVQSIQNLVKLVDYFSENRMGSLIVIEMLSDLENVKDTGVRLNADFSGELLLSLFYGNNPLHDGAVLIKGDKILAAGCLLPLTQSKLRDRSLGTRHRAALGLSEHTDAIVIVTSEETGIISMARGGTLFRKLNRKRLLEHLLEYLQLTPEGETPKPTSESLFKSVSSAFKNAINE